MFQASHVSMKLHLKIDALAHCSPSRTLYSMHRFHFRHSVYWTLLTIMCKYTIESCFGLLRFALLRLCTVLSLFWKCSVCFSKWFPQRIHKVLFAKYSSRYSTKSILFLPFIALNGAKILRCECCICRPLRSWSLGHIFMFQIELNRSRKPCSRLTW